jgi:threonine/homoserine/homoserine lactone efflux protein
MEINLFLKGLLLGFSIAAPVGPIALLCIRRTLNQGTLSGLISGLGAATADGIYGCIAGLGLSLISTILIGQHLWLRLIGGAFLCYLGIKIFLSKPPEQATVANSNNLVSIYASTFLLTLTNPMTILSFTAIFAGLGTANNSGNYLWAIILVLGVFCGSALWWLILCSTISLLRTKLSPQRLQWVNRISGVIIGIFGLFSLLGK